MKKLVVLSAIMLTACASTPPERPEPIIIKSEALKPADPVVLGAERIEKMERREVIQAISECEDAGMKPYVEYVTQRTAFGKVMVPINVHCDPKRQK